MDPDVCLFEIREFAAQARGGLIQRIDTDAGVSYFVGKELAERLQALDEWLTKGGFLPREWQQAGRG